MARAAATQITHRAFQIMSGSGHYFPCLPLLPLRSTCGMRVPREARGGGVGLGGAAGGSALHAASLVQSEQGGTVRAENIYVSNAALVCSQLSCELEYGMQWTCRCTAGSAGLGIQYLIFVLENTAALLVSSSHLYVGGPCILYTCLPKQPRHRRSTVLPVAIPKL